MRLAGHRLAWGKRCLPGRRSTRRVPSGQCRGARVYGRTTTAMQYIEYTPRLLPSPTLQRTTTPPLTQNKTLTCMKDDRGIPSPPYPPPVPFQRGPPAPPPPPPPPPAEAVGVEGGGAIDADMLALASCWPEETAAAGSSPKRY